jgi:hypothetical protein
LWTYENWIRCCDQRANLRLHGRKYQYCRRRNGRSARRSAGSPADSKTATRHGQSNENAGASGSNLPVSGEAALSSGSEDTILHRISLPVVRDLEDWRFLVPVDPWSPSRRRDVGSRRRCRPRTSHLLRSQSCFSCNLRKRRMIRRRLPLHTPSPSRQAALRARLFRLHAHSPQCHP